MWPLCPMVAMGIVPVLQEAGRAVSCFEEGLRAVFLQSACPQRGRKPWAGSPCCWVCGGAMPTPSQPGGAVVEMQPRGKSQTGQQKEKKNGWPEEGGHFLHRPWIPPSGDKNAELVLPNPRLPSPRAQPFLGELKATGQRPLRPLPAPVTYMHPHPAPSFHPHPLSCMPFPTPLCLCNSFRGQSKAFPLPEAFPACV